LARAIAQLTPALDQVIYNAGVLIGWGPFTEVGVDALRENMNVNVFGAYVSTIEFAPFLAKSTFKNKVIVLVSSSFGSITTTKENFEMHSQAFGTPGFNPTAAYDISKVRIYPHLSRFI
jgi:NAD(P)-dependent dehydrogenase (short-subunit alcohol dehydrogenase family)